MSAPQGPREASGQPAPPTLVSRPEAFGPIEMTRYRKDDGRTLLLFAERPAREPGEPGG
ncbi:MAG TPA: hypothetical protein VFW29_04325 [Solirubrobacteraceae bacterium]|nr:hypothetical protein [Solirubrobacteraceae bacterium]